MADLRVDEISNLLKQQIEKYESKLEEQTLERSLVLVMALRWFTDSMMSW